jgi:hypothetical protein
MASFWTLLLTQWNQHTSSHNCASTWLSSDQFWQHASPGTFVHKDLHNCTHVFLRPDATRRALEPPYSGPHQILTRKEKTLQLLVRGKPLTVSTDRVKPVYIFNEADFRNIVCNPAVKATPAIAPPSTSSPPPAVGQFV